MKLTTHETTFNKNVIFCHGDLTEDYLFCNITVTSPLYFCRIKFQKNDNEKTFNLSRHVSMLRYLSQGAGYQNRRA